MRKRIKILPLKRKRKGKTNYRKRLKLLVSNKLRFVVRKSLKNILLQIIEYNEKGDKILVSASSKELEKLFNWKVNRGNIVSAYLTGCLLGKKAVKKNISEVILDIGLYHNKKKSRIYAAVKGISDAGIKIPYSEEVIPPKERIKGKHIENYAKLLKNKDESAYKKYFSAYLKNGINPEDISKIFEDTKKMIMENNNDKNGKGN
jgi:large subunit ribosomal protein L18